MNDSHLSATMEPHYSLSASPVLRGYWEQVCRFRGLWLWMRKLRHLVELSLNDSLQRGKQAEISKCLLSSEKKMRSPAIFFLNNYKDILYFHNGLHFPKQFHKFSMKKNKKWVKYYRRKMARCVCMDPIVCLFFLFKQITNPLEQWCPIEI